MQQGSRSGLTRDEMSVPQIWVEKPYIHIIYVYGIQEVLVLILTHVHVCYVRLCIGTVLKSGTGGGGRGHPQGAVDMVATRHGHGSYST